jgi:hypothetical protein
MNPRVEFTITALALSLLVGAYHLPTGFLILTVSLVVHVVAILHRPE